MLFMLKPPQMPFVIETLSFLNFHQLKKLQQRDFESNIFANLSMNLCDYKEKKKLIKLLKDFSLSSSLKEIKTINPS